MRWCVEPAGPGTVHAYGLTVPPGGIERELDEATLRLLSGDARVTLRPAEKPAPAAPRKPRGKRS